MDMIFAVVWSDDPERAVPDGAALRSEIARAVDGPLADLGVTEYVVNVRDDAVAGAMIDVQVTPLPVLAAVRARVPVASGTACADLLDAVRGLGPVSAWSVTESEPLPAPGPGEDGRCPGMTNLAFLRRPGRMDRDEWLRIWLEEHTPVAIETQSTTGYTQHVVVRALTEGAPEIAGIVEEVFPIEATRDLGVFFDSRGSDERMSANIQAMTASTARFLDDGAVDAIPTGRYVMRIPGPRV
ncbi:EthD domain-containing protein [Dietzia psychralcaliphila]|uniref:EthD domain-containing protein n=1 Tax=Dietzia psychralcaliphila TaxID=139021 RepID=UPI001C1E4594|nr:EthD domain-containing protein [Dietzia psychralcaliphila]